MKPWLFLPAKLAHDLAPLGLRALGAFRRPRVYDWQPLAWRGLHFKNRLGIAGGVDKDGAQIQSWWKFGPGFVEIGTVTPKPQAPNPGRIIDRDYSTKAVWNRMGFPGSGIDAVKANLNRLRTPHLTPLFVNIGKNRTTANENAAADYVECIERLAFAADAFVINISSPNTSGLRELFRPEAFRPFLGTIIDARNRHASAERQRPLLLKLSPDLTDDDLRLVIGVSSDLGIDGWIATNTTLHRDPGSPFPPEGGVSGRPLAERSKKVLSQIKSLKNPLGDQLIVSAGGVLTPDDVSERLSMGADLVQVYSALIYEGPGFFHDVATRLAVIEKK